MCVLKIEDMINACLSESTRNEFNSAEMIIELIKKNSNFELVRSLLTSSNNDRIELGLYIAENLSHKNETFIKDVLNFSKSMDAFHRVCFINVIINSQTNNLESLEKIANLLGDTDATVRLVALSWILCSDEIRIQIMKRILNLHFELDPDHLKKFLDKNRQDLKFAEIHFIIGLLVKFKSDKKFLLFEFPEQHEVITKIFDARYRIKFL